MRASDFFLEGALVHSAENSAMREQVTAEIRRIVHEELEIAIPSVRDYLLHEVFYRLGNDTAPGALSPVFRDGVLSVVRDYLENPRSFNRKY